MGKVKSVMHRVAKGVYRGHAPKDQTPEEKTAQAAEDRRTLQKSDEALANLNRNPGKIIW
jgi:hypothetical protein